MTPDTLRELLANPLPDTDPHALARAAEALGESLLAIRAYQMVLGRDPENSAAWAALADLHAERGDQARARACQRRAQGLAEAEPCVEVEPPSVDPAGTYTDADLVRFCAYFAGREDCHARMWRDASGQTGYSPVDLPLAPEQVRAHLDGSVTLGTYLVRVDDTVTLVCLDLDATKAAITQVAGDAAGTRALRAELHDEGLRLLTAIRGLGLDPLLEDSGWKGRHVWCFLPSPIAASAAHAWVSAVAAHLRPSSPRLHLEPFPKQGKVREGGKGNLVKLPLGLHLRSGRRSVFLDDRGQPIGDPMDWLRRRQRLTLPSLPDLPAPVPTEPAAEAPALVPVAAPGAWSEADFEASAQVGPIYRGCPVIRAIIEGALADRRIEHDAAVVLSHSLGHLPDGVRAVNYVYDRVPGFPTDQRMGAPHRGSVVSCARVRQRVSGVAMRVGCDCKLEPRPGQYAHPLLHAEGQPQRKPIRSLDDTFEALVRAQDRLRIVESEVAALRLTAVETLQTLPGRRWAGGGGEWHIEDHDGLPVLRWTAS